MPEQWADVMRQSVRAVLPPLAFFQVHMLTEGTQIFKDIATFAAFELIYRHFFSF